MNMQDMVSIERSPKDLQLMFVAFTLAGFINLLTQQPEAIDERTMRGLMRGMHEAVHGADYSHCTHPEEEVYMKAAMVDCEELLEHALSIQPEGFSSGRQLNQFMPERYYVGTIADTDLVIEHSLVIQSLFMFLAQVTQGTRVKGQLCDDDIAGVKEWSLRSLQEMASSHFDYAQRENILDNALVTLCGIYGENSDFEQSRWQR